MKKVLVLFLAFSIGLTIAYRERVLELKAENERLGVNMQSLAKAGEEYKFRDSLSAVSVIALNLKVSEMEELRREDLKLISDLQLKPKEIEYITKTTTVTERHVEYKVDTVGCFHHSDKWLQIDACLKDSSMHIVSKDSIAQVVHPIYRKKFLWWKWGVKGFKQEVINFNPHSRVAFSEVIKVQ